jgi:hypothetical protein
LKARCYILFLFWIGLSWHNFAQNVAPQPIIELGETNLAIGEVFTISVIYKTSGERYTVKFPELKNFTKKSQYTTNRNLDSENETLLERRITQEYTPDRSGNTKIPTTVLFFGEQSLSVPPINFTISVGKLSEDDRKFKDFIDGSAYKLISIKDDAFFSVSTNKTSVYTNEPFELTVAFFMTAQTADFLNFTNERNQLDKLIKQLRPANCFNQDRVINEIKSSKSVEIKGKKYYQYILYQNTLFPLNGANVMFPPTQWIMLKDQVAKDRSISNARKAEPKIYTASGINITVKALPKSINNSNIVGNFYLAETINKQKVQTGKSFQYSFKVRGYGNQQLLLLPEIKSDSIFEFFTPKIETRFVAENGKMIPEKSFIFDIVPKFAGNFSLKDYFKIDFFDPATKQYKSLEAAKGIQVVGETINDGTPQTTETRAANVYDNIENLDGNQQTFQLANWVYRFAYIVLALLALAFIYIIWPQ